MTGFGLYVHVPFCSALCPYCDFAVVVGRESLRERYCDALVEEARARASGETATTVFVGGGTPSLLDPRLLARTLAALRDVVPFDDDAEVTMEANPESLEEDSLRVLARAGVNRVSIGVQSFDDDVLRALGRTHDAAAAARAVSVARAAGIASVGVDLIYGTPGESDSSWRGTLARAIDAGPDHVSCYALTIEEGTPFARRIARGAMPAPEDDALAERYEVALTMLADAGYEHYEISNWARAGHACRHNMLYWSQGDYLGIGLGAHSHRRGRRRWNTRSLVQYLEHPGGSEAGAEDLDEPTRAEEWVALRLRLLDGLDLQEAGRRLGRDLSEAAAAVESAGLARARDRRLHLTPRGMLLENEVAARLLNAV